MDNCNFLTSTHGAGLFHIKIIFLTKNPCLGNLQCIIWLQNSHHDVENSCCVYVDKTCTAVFTCNFLSTEKTPLCLENALEPWYEKMEKADAVIKHIPSDSVDHQFLPFVGKFLQFLEKFVSCVEYLWIYLS